jgi:hypothetical protein
MKGELKMATLFEMTQTAKQLYEMLQAEQIDEKTFADTLEAMGTEEKVEGYCQVIKQLQADADMFKEEADRIAARKKTIENSIERMKTTLTDYLLSIGQKKIQAGTFTASLSTSKSVNISNYDEIPPEYLIEQPAKVDKKAIKMAIENGAVIAGAEIVSNNGIRIR